MNKNGEEKKEPHFEIGHNDVTKETLDDFIKNNHSNIALVTGQESNLTIIDFDDYEVYKALCEKYPDMKNYHTVKTFKGCHVYFNYCDEILKHTGNKGLIDFIGVDLLTNRAKAFAPPTSYKLLNGEKFKYKVVVDAPIVDVPEF
jgi:hypothetical protein